MYPNDLYLPLPSSVFLSGQLLHLDNSWHHHICTQICHQLHCQIQRCWFLLRNPGCRVCSYHCYPYQRGTNQRFSATVYSRKVKSENTQPLESLESLREKMALSAQDPNPGKWTLPGGIHRRVFRSPFLGRALRNSGCKSYFRDSSKILSTYAFWCLSPMCKQSQTLQCSGTGKILKFLLAVSPQHHEFTWILCSGRKTSP